MDLWKQRGEDGVCVRLLRPPGTRSRSRIAVVVRDLKSIYLAPKAIKPYARKANRPPLGQELPTKSLSTSAIYDGSLLPRQLSESVITHVKPKSLALPLIRRKPDHNKTLQFSDSPLLPWPHHIAENS